MGNTIVIQIGNTDNKLTQQGWSEFANLVDSRINSYAKTIYFSGGPIAISPWQNYCWVFTLRHNVVLDWFKEELKEIRENYGQDGIALTIGETVII